MIDETDKKILRELVQDARKPYTEIAKHLGLSDVSIYKRVQKLRSKGIIKGFTALLDPEKIGKRATAIVGVKINSENSDSIVERLSGLDFVSEVFTVVGDYDVIFKIYSEDLTDLKEFVEGELKSFKGLKNVDVSIVFDRVKEGSVSV